MIAEGRMILSLVEPTAGTSGNMCGWNACGHEN